MATGDADKKIASTAEHGLRIIESKRIFADKDPLSLARDTSEPVGVRLQALQVIRGTTIDPAAYEHIAALAQDPAGEVAVAQRRWRAAAVVPVMATWALASYGMFMLYFAAGHAGNLDAGETAILVAVLWGAIAIYAALGWGMHYAVRR